MSDTRDLRRWMRASVAEFADLDEFGVVGRTQLAEGAAEALDCLERLDDPDDLIWDLAHEEAERYERVLAGGAQTPATGGRRT